MPIVLEDLDLPALATLAGGAAAAEVQRRLRKDGHGDLRTSFGYVVQRLLEDSPTVGELADALGVTQQAASKTVTEMESRGIAERFPDPRDGRVRRVRLTRRGRDAVEATRRARAAIESSLGLSESEATTTRAVLIRLLEASGGADAVRSRRVREPQ